MRLNLWIGFAGAVALVLAAVAGMQYAAQQAAEQLVAALEPQVHLEHAGVWPGLDGSVRVDAPQLRFSAALGGGLLQARSLRLPRGEVAALLRAAWRDEPDLPTSMAIEARGLRGIDSLVPEAGAGLLGPLSLVPFETLACGGVQRLSTRDYQLMGIDPDSGVYRIAWRRDAVARSLAVEVTGDGHAFGDAALQFDLVDLAPHPSREDVAIGAFQIERVRMAFTDNGYLARRNRFCAQASALAPARWIDQHLAAVEELLATRGVTLSSALAALYRRHIERGGTLAVSLLPDPTGADTPWDRLALAERLRLLNATARHNDEPPIMFGLTFHEAAPPEPDAEPVVETPLHFPTDGPPVAPPTVAVASTNIAARPMAAAAASDPTVSAQTPDDTLRAHEHLDRRGSDAVVPSAPAPMPGSTLALVWQEPTIERLPEGDVAESGGRFIEIEDLSRHIGARVRLVTHSGRRIEGRVAGIDARYLELIVKRAGGSARIELARAQMASVELLGTTAHAR